MVALITLFGNALYVRRLARSKGGDAYLYTFSGSFQFFRESWRELKPSAVLFVVCVAILALTVHLR